MLKEFVSHLRAGNDCTHREARLGLKQNITHQEGLARILLADNDDHRTLARVDFASFLDHVHIELPELEVHCVFVTNKYQLKNCMGVLCIGNDQSTWAATSV